MYSNADFNYGLHGLGYRITVQSGEPLPYPPDIELLTDEGKGIVKLVTSGVFTMADMDAISQAHKYGWQTNIFTDWKEKWEKAYKILEIPFKSKEHWGFMAAMHMNWVGTYQHPNFFYEWNSSKVRPNTKGLSSKPVGVNGDWYYGFKGAMKYLVELQRYEAYLVKKEEVDIMMAELESAKNDVQMIKTELQKAIALAKKENLESQLGSAPDRPQASDLQPFAQFLARLSYNERISPSVVERISKATANNDRAIFDQLRNENVIQSLWHPESKYFTLARELQAFIDTGRYIGDSSYERWNAGKVASYRAKKDQVASVNQFFDALEAWKEKNKESIDKTAVQKEIIAKREEVNDLRIELAEMQARIDAQRELAKEKARIAAELEAKRQLEEAKKREEEEKKKKQRKRLGIAAALVAGATLFLGA